MLLKTIQCKKCHWHGRPTFKECNIVYVHVICPKCHSFIKFIKREDVPERAVIKRRNDWWDKVKKTEVELRPAYILEKELTNLRTKFAAIQMENEQMKDIIKEATELITEAMKREGLIEHVPKWLQEN